MKPLLFFIASSFFVLANFCSLAQQTCCSANETFTNHGNDENFLAAHSIRTSTKKEKFEGQLIRISTPDSDSANVYLIESANKSNKWVFVFHEWWGLNDHIKSEADDLFKSLDDVNVMCLDLYDGQIAESREKASEIMQSREDYRIRQIIHGAIDYVGYEADVSTIGWCFGGTWSMQAAILMGRQAKACVIYYGMPELNRGAIMPLKANVMGIFAEEDKWITKEIVSEFSDLMDVLQKNLDLVIFPADHAFANPSGANYNMPLAKEAKKISTEFLKQNFEQ